jgi:phage tail protein X
MRRARIGAVLAVICALPGLAAAQQVCPTGVARDGVWLEFPDRTVMTRVLSDGRVAETEFMHDDTTVYGYITLPIGLVVESWALVNGRVPPADRERVTYTGTPSSVPFPAPGARFDGTESSRFADGAAARYAITAMVGAARTVAVGPCRYIGLPVQVTRTEPGGPVLRDSMMHLQELGVTIYLGFSDDGAMPVDVLPTAIGDAPPLGVVGGGPPGAQPPPLPAAPGASAPAPAK